jgi:hypothetical protein
VRTHCKTVKNVSSLARHVHPIKSLHLFPNLGGGSRVHSMVELCSTKTARVTATLHLLRAEAQARVHADAAVLQRQLRTVLAQRGQEDLGGSLS